MYGCCHVVDAGSRAKPAPDSECQEIAGCIGSWDDETMRPRVPEAASGLPSHKEYEEQVLL